MRRHLAALAAILTITGCAGVNYGKTPHAALVTDPRCDPQPTENTGEAPSGTLPYYLVTSRLPDCRSAPVSLTSWRSDRVRYGRFGKSAPATTVKAKVPRVPLALSAESDWWAALARDAATHDGRVLIYVHGFNETFESSGTDTGQIARMTGFAGPVVHYSWPSLGSLTGYLVDETNMYWDERNFRNFLARLAREPWTKEIVLVGHSLGGRLAIPAIEYVDQTSKRTDSSNISNIVLLSPDVDRADFERDIAEEVLAARRVDNDRRITLYVSTKDRALAISRRLHGYARLGSPFCDNPFVRKAMKKSGIPARCYPRKSVYDQAPAKSGFTVVDTTEVSGGGTGHSDFLKSGPVCRDFAAVVGGQLTGGGDRVATVMPHVFGLKIGAGREVCGK